MKPESICVSFETAKKLKEAGWDKECVFMWVDEECVGIKLIREDDEAFFMSSHCAYSTYHAPTSAEIELPKTHSVKCVVDRFASDRESGWGFWNEGLLVDNFPTEVEAKATMWLRLMEAE